MIRVRNVIVSDASITTRRNVVLASPTSPQARRSVRSLGLRRSNYIFTSESVSEGHPDKVADRISDTVVDAFLAADPVARVACETMVTTNRIILAGEVRVRVRRPVAGGEVEVARVRGGGNLPRLD